MDLDFQHDQLTCDVQGNPIHKLKKGKKSYMQTMLYLRYFAIFGSKLCQNKSIRDTVCMLFLPRSFMKAICFLSKWMRGCNFIKPKKMLMIEYLSSIKPIRNKHKA